uniref:NADH-ubiquinone oxidoreductase chain 6 n=2 Tax=Limenitis TaxID=124410 RepID=A0A1W6LQM2_9NEOP|nr:NADH dehydrogenase subunit 6 [Limenitis doerriesi]YP_009368803.1 NADH dehydrogenase subunit 6 [Limenitis helmanni]AQX44296.1 NADH dehydrogenase subunit 6 [Limenitis doerriesi]ARN58075.1 NADH dehydrogenase subunit 6 [Limenitis helmanni]
MLKMILSIFLISISILLYFINHPLAMGILILIQTLFTCLISGMLINTYWFSYILFLIFLGGLLVLFIYVSSVASNELFKIHFTEKFSYIYIIFIMIFSILYKNNLIWMNFSFNDEMINFFNSNLFFNNEYNFNLSKLYNNQNYFMMMMLIIYLFITLVAIVKITNIFFGPLRSFN